LKSLDKKLIQNAKGLISTVVDVAIDNPNNPDSMNFFQADTYRFYFLMSFMKEFFEGNEISQNMQYHLFQKNTHLELRDFKF
tara:strand:- start:345 stop:590 length:246 start_codon:yes stop_codon:yes gene_type:complete